MSRIGRKPIAIPNGVSVDEDRRRRAREGAQGTLTIAGMPRESIARGDRGRSGARSPRRGQQADARAARSRARWSEHGAQGVVGRRSRRGSTIRASATAPSVASKSSRSLLGFSHPIELACPGGALGRRRRNVTDQDRGHRPRSGSASSRPSCRDRGRRSRTRARASATSTSGVRRKVGRRGSRREDASGHEDEDAAMKRKIETGRTRRARGCARERCRAARRARAHRVPQRAAHLRAARSIATTRPHARHRVDALEGDRRRRQDRKRRRRAEARGRGARGARAREADRGRRVQPQRLPLPRAREGARRRRPARPGFRI